MLAKNAASSRFDVYSKYQPFRASGEAAGHALLTQLLHAQEGRIDLLARRWTRDALSGHARGVPPDVMVFHNEITESVISRSGADFMPRDLRLMI